MNLRQSGVLAGVVSFLFACDAVPALTFLADDDATPLGDGGAALEGGCPGEPPPGMTACCGDIACAGDCDAHCGDCLSRCTQSQACCARSGGVSCHDPSFICN